MTAGQRKLGELVVVERVLLPVACVVTGIAAVAVVTFVCVILLVTTHASHRNVAIALRIGMARFATCSTVLIKQRKAGLRMVVVRHAPIFRAVTSLTLLT